MLAQSDRGRRAGRSPSPTISISAIRSGRRSWASSSAASAASRKPARRSISRSSPAMCRSTTRPTARRSCRRPRSAASACSTISRKSATLAFKREGEAILLIGETTGWLGQSMYLREICGREEGAPPPVDLIEERENGDFVRALILDGTATAAHDLSDGGLAVALAEMAMASGIGATLDAAPDDIPAHAFWFGEDQARYLVTVPAAQAARRCSRARRRPACRCATIGTTGGDALTLAGERPLPLAALARALRRLAAGLYGRRALAQVHCERLASALAAVGDSAFGCEARHTIMREPPGLTEGRPRPCRSCRRGSPRAACPMTVFRPWRAKRPARAAAAPLPAAAAEQRRASARWSSVRLVWPVSVA